MNTENKIVEHIDNAVSEQLSARAWQRLESRLEHRTTERNSYRAKLQQQWTRQMIFAVAAVACMLFAGIFTLFTIFSQHEGVGKRAVAFAPAKLEKTPYGNLVITPQPNATDNRVLAKAKIEKTTPNLNIATLSDATPVITSKKQPLKEPVAENTISNNNLVTNEYPVVKEEITPNKPTKTVNTPVAAPKIARKERDVSEMQSNDAFKTDLQDIAVTATRKTPANRRNSAAEVVTTGVKQADKAQNAARVELKPNAAKSLQQASITDLYWLVGTWKNETDTHTPFEAWTQNGTYELHGTGFAIGSAGDTTLLETFRIKQEGNTLALYLPLDKTGTIYRYELQHYMAYTWHFVNDEMSFPQRIELHRLTKNNFIFTMQNGDEAVKKISTKRFQNTQSSMSEVKNERKMSRLK